MAPALFAKAQELGLPMPAELTEPGAELPPGQVVGVLRQIAAHLFPLLAGDAEQLS